MLSWQSKKILLLVGRFGNNNIVVTSSTEKQKNICVDKDEIRTREVSHCGYKLFDNLNTTP